MSNAHRKNKTSFQAFLTADEAELVETARDITGAKTDRELLVQMAEIVTKAAESPSPAQFLKRRPW